MENSTASPANAIARIQNARPFSLSTSSTPIGSKSSSSVGKKVVIKNLGKPKPTGGDNDKFSALDAAIVAIQKKQPATATLGHLYNMVQSHCQQSYGGELYALIAHRLQDFANFISQATTDKMTDETNDITFLEEMNSWWHEYTQQLEMVRTIFIYLDRFYVLSKRNLIPIWDLGLKEFRECVLQSPKLRQRLIDGLLRVIATERAGRQIDRNLVRSLLRMLSNLDLYKELFEPEFLKASEELYSQEGQERVTELDVTGYLQYIDRRLKEEVDRSTTYLDFETQKPLLHCVEKVLIADHMDSIAKGLDNMIANGDKSNLSLLYRLSSRAKEGLKSVRHQFSSYIKKIGKAFVCDDSREPTLVADLMGFKDKLDGIIIECFEGSDKFKQCEKDAFDYFINTKQTKPAQLIAKFMDLRLRSGNKACTDEELDGVMDKAIVLFRFIEGKDVFEAFYKNDLSKRLLYGRSASYDAEKSMLAKLKQECGPGFTMKLEGMFKDMELSKDLVNSYKQYQKSAEGNELSLKSEFSVYILTMGFWPNYQPMEVNIPQELYECQENFKQFYTTKHSGRKLQWQYSLMTAIVKGRFKKGVKELDLSFFQTLVLLAFNDKSEISYEELSEMTKIEKNELKRTLQSLACGKSRVIQKIPRGKDVNESDKFVFNDDFADPKYRIRISQVIMKETKEEVEKTEEQVFQDRQYEIDAAVVRIMKSRKTMTHTSLIGELYKQLRFPARSTDLKKRIESLIEREYLERDKTDANTYNYVT
ncbi:hypothetical protein QR680_018953 [Steinernema hermaphroditum]|uniref:Cullin family profile domain-containing protein n=1 Tax=Steinernema hermaphroditum TaxID=289476 RepID=A0AA39HLU6_9BILA|nr:hypothetical protein QR680_018953 [Steinernema hermaphroditum]